MKKIAILLTILLSASALADYTIDVRSESYRETYQVPTAVTKNVIQEQTSITAGSVNNDVNNVPSIEQPQKVVEATEFLAAVGAVDVANKGRDVTPLLSIRNVNNNAPEDPILEYSIQLVVFSTQKKAAHFVVKLLPSTVSIWEHYKEINGTPLYSVLYGNYATRDEAMLVIANLPKEFAALKPFIQSISDIKKSAFPKLNKWN